MKTSTQALLAIVLLTACEKAPDSSAASTRASATAPPPSATVSLAIASSTQRVVPSASSAPATTPSPSASAAADSPCPEGARKDDDARYCITLPAKKLAVSYEGDKPARGIREELEIAGDRVVISVGPAPAAKTVPQLKEAAIKSLGPSLVDSGDLPNGYWTDRKDKDGRHIVEGTVVSKYEINCMHWVRDEKNLEAARAVCKSLRTY